MSPRPPQAKPPDSVEDQWLPAALGYVAAGSRVFILSGAEGGRSGTVLTVGGSTGLADGCNVRLDGAKGTEAGWCLGNSLDQVVPNEKQRVKLPKWLHEFHTDRKGPDRKLYFPTTKSDGSWWLLA